MDPSLILVRHGLSDYNVRGLLNGDPCVAVGLTAEGRRQAEDAAEEIAHECLDLAVHTRFPRTRETLDIILAGRDVPRAEYQELDDVRVGRFEGRPIGEYRRWRREHDADEAPSGGESRLDALRRYADGFARLAEEPASLVLAVLHDIPIRVLLNAAAEADPLDGPVRHVGNASIHRIDADRVRRAAAAMRLRAGGRHRPTLDSGADSARR